MDPASDAPAPQVPGLDLADAMARLGVSWEELKDLLQSFPNAVRREMAALNAAGDLPAIRTAAHTMAGLVGNYRAKPLWAAAKALEKAAKEGRSEEVPALLENVRALADEACTGAEMALKA
jgi:hypothetical protein